MHHGITFGFAKVCSPVIFETCFSYNKDILNCLVLILYLYIHFLSLRLFLEVLSPHLINY